MLSTADTYTGYMLATITNEYHKYLGSSLSALLQFFYLQNTQGDKTSFKIKGAVLAGNKVQLKQKAEFVIKYHCVTLKHSHNMA